MTIFKAYDIRGIYPSEINEDMAYNIGKAFVDFIGCKKVVIGQDMRKSSPSLFKALTNGITEQGADVIDIGMVATPMLSYAVMNWNIEAGIMISASHNPGKYNAFKLIRNGKKGALQIHDGNGIKELEKLASKNEFKKAESRGKIIRKEISAEYKKHVLGFSKEIKDLKIVVDYGNGVGSLSAGPVLESLPIEVKEFFKDPDGSFPNHEPNPHDIKNLEFLKKKVVEEKADLGIFFDGDADRSLLIDEKGRIIFPDFMLGVLAVDELKNNPGRKVYYDLRFTKAVEEKIKENKGIPMMMRVGNPFYKEVLLKENGLLAGEFSGHIMFKEHFNIDDGLFAAIKFMAIMSKQRQKASELVRTFEKYFTTEEINLKVKDADETLENIRRNYKDANIITIDGLLIQYKDWWVSLRKSNTEPLIRIRLEANTKDMMESKREELLSLIRE